MGQNTGFDSRPIVRWRTIGIALYPNEYSGRGCVIDVSVRYFLIGIAYERDCGTQKQQIRAIQREVVISSTKPTSRLVQQRAALIVHLVVGVSPMKPVSRLVQPPWP